MTRVKLIAAACAFALVPMANANAANGINALIQVTQLKSQNANEEALHGADKQRDLVSEQKLEHEKRTKQRGKKPRRK